MAREEERPHRADTGAAALAVCRWLRSRRARGAPTSRGPCMGPARRSRASPARPPSPMMSRHCPCLYTDRRRPVASDRATAVGAHRHAPADHLAQRRDRRDATHPAPRATRKPVTSSKMSSAPSAEHRSPGPAGTPTQARRRPCCRRRARRSPRRPQRDATRRARGPSRRR